MKVGSRVKSMRTLVTCRGCTGHRESEGNFARVVVSFLLLVTQIRDTLLRRHYG